MPTGRADLIDGSTVSGTPARPPKPPNRRPEVQRQACRRGVRAIVRLIEEKARGATIIVTGIFPRNDNIAVMSTIDKVNAELAAFAKKKSAT